TTSSGTSAHGTGAFHTASSAAAESAAGAVESMGRVSFLRCLLDVLLPSLRALRALKLREATGRFAVQISNTVARLPQRDGIERRALAVGVAAVEAWRHARPP